MASRVEREIMPADEIVEERERVDDGRKWGRVLRSYVKGRVRSERPMPRPRTVLARAVGARARSHRSHRTHRSRARYRADHQLLGKGGFAMCYKTRCVETSREYALKVANGETLTRKLKDKLSIEIRIHRELSHASIVRLDRCFEDVGGSVYLLLELCEHRSLADYVRRNGLLGETEVRRHAVQLSEAVSYLHERRIIHRDLKVSARVAIAPAQRR